MLRGSGALFSGRAEEEARMAGQLLLAMECGELPRHRARAGFRGSANHMARGETVAYGQMALDAQEDDPQFDALARSLDEIVGSSEPLHDAFFACASVPPAGTVPPPPHSLPSDPFASRRLGSFAALDPIGASAVWSGQTDAFSQQRLADMPNEDEACDLNDADVDTEAERERDAATFGDLAWTSAALGDTAIVDGSQVGVQSEMSEGPAREAHGCMGYGFQHAPAPINTAGTSCLLSSRSRRRCGLCYLGTRVDSWCCRLGMHTILYCKAVVPVLCVRFRTDPLQ